MFGPTGDDDAFRKKIRTLLANAAGGFSEAHPDVGFGFGGWSNEFLRWAGSHQLIGLTWPREEGGRARPVTDLYAFLQEVAYARVPAEALFYVEAVGYMIRSFGSSDLKRRFLPRMLTGDLTVAEAMSEPDAGSDLLSLRTRAVLDGDEFVLDGQKIWISNGWLADFAVVAAVTDPDAPRPLRLSMFLVDLEAPGVTRRGIEDVSGETAFSEIFFDGVRLPKEDLIGKQGQGLELILDVLEWDRLWGRCVKPSFLRRELEDLIEYARATERNNHQLWDDPMVRSSLAQLAVEIEVSDSMFSHAVDALARDGAAAPHEVSIAKVYADELGQRFYDTGMQLLGPFAPLETDSSYARLGGSIGRGVLNAHGVLLAGGTPEIQMTTIAVRGLGLPRADGRPRP